MNVSKIIWNRSSRLFFSSLTPRETELAYYQNPCIRLKQYLEISIFDENDSAFSPGINDMVAAEKLFVSKPNHLIKKISSTIDPEKFPAHDLPEVAIIGQSNAGKSSLLKAIFKENPELRVKTSKKAGQTKSAQFFRIGSKLCLVDMPGYGENQPAWFSDVVECYLKRRRNLVKTLFLIDGKIGFQSLDDVALEMLEEFSVPYVIVMTKTDTAPDSLLLRNLLHLKKIKDKYASLCCFSQIFMETKTLEPNMKGTVLFLMGYGGILEKQSNSFMM